MSESPRRKAREIVLKALYASECMEDTPQESLKKLTENIKLTENNLLFVRKLFRAVMQNTPFADEKISALIKNWEISRLATIDKVILRMAIIELAEFPDIPVKVVLNESIELAKKYSTEESSKFVNGVLDTFIKKELNSQGET
jgi:transcription antitermination protein NusB